MDLQPLPSNVFQMTIRGIHTCIRVIQVRHVGGYEQVSRAAENEAPESSGVQLWKRI